MATLAEIMTTDVVTADPTSPVAEVAEAMVKGRFGSVVVVDGGWIAGIFTERDVLRAAASGSDLRSSPVSEWMTIDPLTVEPTMEADDALEIMASQGFRHLPVVDGKQLLGVVSLRDVLSTKIARAPR
jgi:CBS domain-containing protein